MFQLMLMGCNPQEPAPNEMAGTWVSSDGAEVVIRLDGTFEAKFLPAELILLPPQNYRGERFDGHGKWFLRKGELKWEMHLDFVKVSNEKYSCVFSLLISGSNVMWENKPPWYLFLWKEGEGSERYKFLKK
jgi:hypothetical protein